MIISHKHRYLFIEVPRTGSTAISRELCEMYDGESILRKHAHYNEFFRVAKDHEKTYFVFQGSRNPLDQVVSDFFKFKNNHKGNFTNPTLFKSNGGWIDRKHLERFDFIQKYNADFPDYFNEYYKIQYLNMRVPYFTPYDWPGPRIQHIISFENLATEFEDVIELIGIQLQRSLPIINKTSNRKQDCYQYYCPEIHHRVVSIFGPYMKHRNYRFPDNWGDITIPIISRWKFKMVEKLGGICFQMGVVPYWKTVKSR